MKELEIRIRKLLLKVGVDPSLLGYKYLTEAIRLVYEDDIYMHEVCKKLYPEIAEKCKTTASRVERAMRHAIGLVVNSNPDIADVLIVAPNLVTGTYNNSTFIALCVEALKRKTDAEIFEDYARKTFADENACACVSPFEVRDIISEQQEIINRQKAEIERLQNRCENCEECTNWKCDIHVTRAEAMKQLADKLQDRCTNQGGCIYASDIGAVLKEVVGEK